jgi:hypothetical protein
VVNATGQVNLIAFGTYEERRYEFQNVERAIVNFSKVDSKVTRVTGFDGGIDEYRLGRSPLAVGQVDVSLFLQAETPEEMTEKRDAVAVISSWGTLPLLMAPYDSAKGMRFCWARCINVSMPEDANMGTEHLQPVTISFQVADPRWYHDPYLFWIGEGDEVTLDAGTYLGSERGGYVLTDDDEIEIIYQGKVPTPLVLVFDNQLLNPGITGPWEVTHTDQYGNILNQWEWVGTMGTNAQFTMDAGRLIFKTSAPTDVAQWSNINITRGTGFIWLQPGYNKLHVVGTTADVAMFIYYSDAFAS